MNVLIHDGSPGPGGALTSLVALLYVLDQHGHRGDIVVESSSARRFLRTRLAEASLGDRFRVVAGVGGLRPSGRIAYAWREVRRAARLRWLVHRNAYDVVLGNNAPGTNLAASIATGGLPYVQYVRGPVGRSRAVSAVFRRATRVWSVGPTVAKNVQDAGGHVHRVLDEGLAPSQRPTPRHADARGLLWAAAWMDWKGPELMLDAWRRSHDRDPLLMLTVAADEPVKQPPALHGLEFRMDAPLDAARASCLTFVHTALLPEPFGRTILEAMWAGLCPIVPDSGSGPRLVEHGRTGLIYETGSVSSLSATLERVRRSPSLARALGSAASQSARRYSAEAIFTPVVAELEHLVNNGKIDSRRRTS